MADFDNLFAWIIPYVKNVVTKTKTDKKHCCIQKITATDFSCSLLHHAENFKNDMVMLCIPYAGLKIKWQVMFDGTSEKSPPDFLLHENFYPSLDDLKHLSNWDPNNEESLYLVIDQLLKSLFNNEVDNIRKVNPILHSQIDEIIKSPECNAIEVLSQVPGSRSNEQNVQILIQLSVDFQKIPDIHYKEAPAIDPDFLYPVLLVNIPPTFDRIYPTLHMSKRMEFVLGGRNSFSLPEYAANLMTLLEYTQAVVRNIEKMIDILVEGHLKRREYVAAILCQFESNVLEYDSENFSKVSLLFSHQDFYFSVHVALGRFFPHDQPKVIMQSSYHVTKQGSPFAQRFSAYPYSPRWSGTEMAKRLRAFLLESVDSFKGASIKNGVI